MASKADLKGMTALVTGGSSGIGLEFCRTLASRGADILMVSIQEKELAESCREISDTYGVKTYSLLVDLTEEDAATRIEEYIDAEGIEIGILVNNAGIFSFNLLADTPSSKIGCFIDLHIRAVTSLSLRFASRMKARGGGYILNMSSMSCWMPMPGIAMYASTKAYIRVFSRALHYEMRDSGVKVTVACPGGIATDLFGLPEPLKRLAVRIGALQTPGKFARNAIGKMLGGRSQYINGWLNRFSIFFIGITPTPVRMMVKRLMLDRGIRRP